MLTKHNKVCKRYAKALLSLAIENGILHETYADMILIKKAFSYDKQLKVVLKSPIIREGKKQNILSRLFEGKVHPTTMHYLKIIARKQRAALLEGISHQFLYVYKAYLHIEPVIVTTAFPIDKPLKEKVLEVAMKLTDKTIDFEEKVDPALIGGFILDLGDRRYDVSIKRKLSDLKRHLKVK